MATDSRELVLAYLSPLQEIRADLPEALTSYVLEGEGAQLLEELPTINYQGQLGLAQKGSSHPTRNALFARAELGPEQWMRLGTLWSRIPKHSPRENRLGGRRSEGAYPGCLDLLLRESELSQAGVQSPFRSVYLFAKIVRAAVDYDPSHLHYHWFISEASHHFLALSRYRDFDRFWREQFPLLREEFELYLDFEILRFLLPSLQPLTPSESERIQKVAKPLIEFRLRAESSPVHIASALESLVECGYNLEPYAACVLECAMKRDEYVSGTARYALKYLPETALKHLTPLLQQGPPKIRARAALALSAVQNDEAFEHLQARLELEKSKVAKSAIQYCLDCRELGSFREKVQSERIALRAHAQARGIDAKAPLPKEARQLLRQALERIEGEDGLSDAIFEELLHFLENLVLIPKLRDLGTRINTYKAREELKVFLAHPEVNLLHLARLIVILGKTRIDKEDEIEVKANPLDELALSYAANRKDLCALDLLSAFVVIGADPAAIVNALICTLKQEDWEFFECSKLNRFLSERPYLLVGPLRLESISLDLLDRNRDARAPGFEFLRDLQEIPTCLQDMIFVQVFDAPDDIRKSMQLSLSAVPNVEGKICEQLKQASAKTRRYAAQWLAILARPSTAPAIHACLEKEKNALVRSSLQDALEPIEGSNERGLDPESLLEQAISNHPQRLPTAMRAFPFRQMPDLQWLSSGKQVDPRIAKSWILYAFQRGQAKPDKEISCYLRLVDPKQAEHWGHAIFLAWVLADPKLPGYLRWQKLSPREYLREHWSIPGTDFASVLHWFETQALNQESSVAPRKGLLALVAASNSSGAATAAKSFILRNSTERLAHCRAILGALSSMECSSALATLSEVSQSVKSAPVCAAAQEELLALAQRKGWTRSELHDRVIARAGLDNNGERDIHVGEQTLTLVLDHDLKLKYRNPKGQLRARLPSKRKSESDTEYESRKQMVACLRRDIKSIAKLQSKRLDDAMILQRSWSVEAWKRDLAQHPILSQVITRIIWSVQEGEQTRAFFRPLNDQSLSTVKDETFSLPASGHIRIAHANHMSSEQRIAWMRRVRAYETQLQLNQLCEPYVAPTHNDTHNQLLPKEKLKVDLFHLHKSATRWGFERDAPVSSRRYVSYSRSYPEVGMRVRLDFSGANLPMKAQEVEVEALCAFSTDSCAKSGLMHLKELPPLLLLHAAQALRVMSQCEELLAR